MIRSPAALTSFGGSTRATRRGTGQPSPKRTGLARTKRAKTRVTRRSTLRQSARQKVKLVRSWASTAARAPAFRSERLATPLTAFDTSASHSREVRIGTGSVVGRAYFSASTWTVSGRSARSAPVGEWITRFAALRSSIVALRSPLVFFSAPSACAPPAL